MAVKHNPALAVVEKFLNQADIKINGDRQWDIKIHDQSVLTDTILKGTLGFGDGYTNSKWDCDQIDVFFEKLLRSRKQKKIRKLRSIGAMLQDVRSVVFNTQVGKRAFQVGEQHYDLGNGLYEYMLGPSMGYSCGMYMHEDDDLTTAQINKFDNLCKLLKLKPGMKILEIGCGWGTFARHAINNYGVSVVGLTVSREQKKYAEKVCEGLDAEFKLLDYQKLDSSFDGQFDRVVSIEMIEAVGKKNFRTYFKAIERVLKPGGLAGLQAIVGTGGMDPFLSTRIFPNGLVPSQKQIVDGAHGILRIKNWQAFGRDYDRTLLDWDENFRKYWPEIQKLTDDNGNKLYDDKFYRMWRYYLLCCAATFRVGVNDDAQIVLSKISAASELK